MADGPEDRPGGLVADLGEVRAHRTADRIADRHRGDPGRLAEHLAAQGTLSEDLRTAIRESGHSLYALAKLAGVDHGQLSRFLRGERSITLETADRIAEELGLRLL